MEDEEAETEQYKKLRAEFVERVFRFHERRGTPLKRLPMLGGRELNIFHLYQEVQKRGGSEKVTKVRMWGEIARTFNLPSTVTSASYAIRNHFIKILEQFEAVENGLVPERDVDQMTTPSHTLPTLPILPAITRPHPQPRKPMMIQSSAVLSHQMSTTTTTSERDLGMSRLTRSLLSGLPNELDFAFNILLILSHSNSLSIQKNPFLLDIILAHVAIFSDDDPGLESMYIEVWNRDSQLDFHTFWEMAVPEWVYTGILKGPITKSLCECVLFNRGTLLLGKEATPTQKGAESEEEGVEGLRVSQVATVMSNLSTNENSAEILADHSGVVRFLTLAMLCELPSVHVPALDCLANIASYLSLQCVTEDGNTVWSTDSILVDSLHHCLMSEDRFLLKRGIEILGKLSHTFTNLPVLLSTPPEVYTCLFHSLLLPDCELTMITLDSLYSLTLQRRQIAHRVARVQGMVDTLVWLLLFKIEGLPAGSLSRMKLFFIGDSASLAQYLADIQGKAAAPVAGCGGRGAMPTSVGGGASLGAVASSLAANQVRSHPTVVVRTSSTLLTNQSASSSRGNSPSLIQGQSSSRESGKQTAASSLYSILGALSHTGSKNTPSEEFAIEWLKQSFESQPTHHLVLLVDMYAQYVLHCSSKGKKTFLNNSEFISVIRQVFPLSQMKEVRTVAKKVIHFITGLKRLNNSLRSTPPLSNHTPSPVASVTSSTASHILSPVTLTTSSTSSHPHSPVASVTSSATRISHTPSPGSSATSHTPSPVSLATGSTPQTRHTPSPVSLATGSTPQSRHTPSPVSLATGSTPQTRHTPSPVSLATGSTPQTSHTPSPVSLATSSAPQTGHNSITSATSLSTTGIAVSKNDVIKNDAIVSKNDVMASRAVAVVTNSHVSPTDMHFASSSFPPSHTVTPHTVTPSLVSPSPSTILPTRTQPVATDTKLENPSRNLEGVSHSLPHTSDTTPSRPINGGRGQVGVALVNDIHDSKTVGVKRRLGEGVTNCCYDDGGRRYVDNDVVDHRSLGCVESASVASTASASDQDQRSRSGTPIPPFSGELVPEAKRIKVDSSTNISKQQQTQASVVNSLNPTVKQQVSVTRQTSFTTSSIRFVNKTPVVVPGSVAESSNQSSRPADLSNRFADSTSQSNKFADLSNRSADSSNQSNRSAESSNLSNRFADSPSQSNRSADSPSQSNRSADSSNQSNRSADSSNQSSKSTSDSVRPVCLWENCMSMRYSWPDLLHHAINSHISPLPTLTPSPCHWAGCSTTPLRMKPSLMRHVETHHCSPGPKPVPPSVATTLAKLKHCPPLENEVESPLTKAVRITAALVLRNLSRLVPSTHTVLRKHEQRLCEVALSTQEAAQAIRECLTYLNLPSPPPHTLTTSHHHTLSPTQDKNAMI